jgi:peptide/nickel transport system permease protein
MSTETAEKEIQGPSLSLSRETWKRFRRNRRSLFALVVLAGLFVVGAFAPLIAGTKPIVCRYKGSLYFPCLGYYPMLIGLESGTLENPVFTTDRFRGSYPANLKKKDPDSWAVWPLLYADPYRKTKASDWTGPDDKPVSGFASVVEADNNLGPSLGHPLGTDEFGRSVLARMVHGTSIALLVGFVSVGISLLIGLTIGSAAGFLGGNVDMALSRFMEVVQSVPGLILILALISLIERTTIFHVMAVLGCTGWVGIARLTRGEFLKLKTLDYVTAARALGFSTPRVIVKHVLPNSLAPVLVSVSFGIAGAILTESSLSFLGFGVQPPTPSWGAILKSGFADYSQWWLILFPGLGVFVAVLTYNLIGDGLQHAIDPRLR